MYSSSFVSVFSTFQSSAFQSNAFQPRSTGPSDFPLLQSAGPDAIWYVQTDISPEHFPCSGFLFFQRTCSEVSDSLLFFDACVSQNRRRPSGKPPARFSLRAFDTRTSQKKEEKQ